MATQDAFDIQVTPFIPASKNLPETTTRALILGIFLAVVFAASTTFVGLKIARTIAGSIPAALISMLVLRRFRNANILENNMVQTIASAGESVASGVIFTVPALIILHYWDSFHYFQTMLITLIGGILGVMFSVPLRRSMIIKENLPYPEGFATGEILMAGEDNTGQAKILLKASLFSALLAFLQSGFKIAAENIQYWTKLGPTVTGGSLALSPVLMAAGYIVGMKGLIAFVVGGFLTWGIALPILVAYVGLPESPDLSTAILSFRKSHFQYIGVGILAIGGIWSVVSVCKQIANAIKASYAVMKERRHSTKDILRTDRDIPFHYVMITVGIIAIPTFLLFLSLVKTELNLTLPLFWTMVILTTLFSLITAFIAAAVASYIVGIVGTTSLPISGIGIAVIIGVSSIVYLLLSSHIQFTLDIEAALKAAGIIIILTAIVCVAAAVGGDNMQDLKAGQIVGATPWKQQAMLAVGVVASALVIPFILQTTYEAYGIGDILPRAGMNPEQALPAPQANLMATIVKGFFNGQLPWGLIQLGGALAVIAICIDEYLKYKKSSYRFPPLLLALGVYLPFSYMTGFLVGGIIHLLVHRHLRKRKGPHNKNVEIRESEHSSGILCASGLIAGESILGAILTIPFAWYQSTDVLALKFMNFAPYDTIIGLLLYAGLGWYLYRQGIKKT